MSDIFDTETIDANGQRYRVEYCFDTDHGEPWKESDGHGIVSEWTTRNKRPGERVLCADGHSRRYYDVEATLVRARRDSWGVNGGQQPGETARAYAARAVEADYEFLRAWCADEWCYIGVVVTLLDARGVKTRYSESLWGVETRAEYHRTIPAELIAEIDAQRGKVRSFDDVAAEQGWTEQTCLGLCREFIVQAGLQEDLNRFATEKQARQ
jgi:hypothetical protein